MNPYESAELAEMEDQAEFVRNMPDVPQWQPLRPVRRFLKWIDSHAAAMDYWELFTKICAFLIALCLVILSLW